MDLGSRTDVVTNRGQKVGLAAILSIVAAIGSYVATCTGHPGWGILAALISIPMGIIGFVAAASPRVRGGIISIIAIILGVLAIIGALVGFLTTGVGPAY